MRIAPRTMLISTGSFVGIDPDADEQYRELRELALQVGDLRSLAIATAGRIMSFTFNDIRVPEAAALASEVEDRCCTDMDWDAVPEIDIILIAVARAHYANCEFDAAASGDCDAILARPHDEPTIELAGALTFGVLSRSAAATARTADGIFERGFGTRGRWLRSATQSFCPSGV